MTGFGKSGVTPYIYPLDLRACLRLAMTGVATGTPVPVIAKEGTLYPTAAIQLQPNNRA